MTAQSDHLIRLFLAFCLGLIGAFAAVASVYATPARGASTLSCGLEALSCDVALTSRLSKIGAIPLGVFGLFYFSFWTLNLRAFQRTGDGIYRAVFSWVTMTGAVVSMILGSIMFFVLKAPCLYCLLSHASNLISVALLWARFLVETRDTMGVGAPLAFPRANLYIDPRCPVPWAGRPGANAGGDSGSLEANRLVI